MSTAAIAIEAITTVAGTGTEGYSGDNRPATDADLDYPEGVAVDGAGNLYIAERYNHRVRKVDHATGVITTVAGTGTAGYNGDNKLAIDADLNAPFGVAVDGVGNLYIVDRVNYRVRRVDHATGVITTVAGTGTAGYNGDNQLAIAADLNVPEGVAVDGVGNLYIADLHNHRVRRVDPAGVITTVAGTGAEGYNGDDQPAIHAELDYPEGVAVDEAGNLYIAERYNHRVRKVDHATGFITTVAGTGTEGYNGDNQPAIDAELHYPNGVVVDRAGNLYIADEGNQRVRRVDPATGFITTVAGTGAAGYNGDNQPAIDADLDYPEGVAVNGAGSLYISDTVNHRVRSVEAVVFSVAQDPPDPVVMTAGVSTQLAFTVSANTTVTGQTITLDFPSGVGLAPSGVVRYVCPDTGTDTELPVTVGADGSVNVIAEEITTSTTCFYTADVWAPAFIEGVFGGVLEGAISIGGTTEPIRFRVAEPVFTVVQDAPDPVMMTAGVTTQLEFTVSANCTVPAGQTITLGFPSGVGLAQGGVVRYVCPDTGTDTELPVTVGADGSVNVTASEITASTTCFYSVDVQAPVFIEDVPEGTISIGGTTQPIHFRVEEPVFTVVQDPPDPVVMTGGLTTQLKFTVSANCTVPAGRTITLGFPSGVGLAPGGTVRFHCPDTGTDTPLPVTTGPDGSVIVTASEITASTTCFYTADVQAPAMPGGTVAVAGTSQPIHFSIEAAPSQTRAVHRRYAERDKREASKSTAPIAFGLITTVAGTGTQGYNGDNQSAVNADLDIPCGGVVDGAGNLYIADVGNQRVRRVDPAGVITTVAGTGTQGYNGDNQSAIDAELGQPRSVAVDGAGNLYIADRNNQRVRKVDHATRVITTVAGTGTYGYNGDNQRGIDAELNVPFGVVVDGAGNLYIADVGNQRVRRVDPAGVITTVAGTGTGGYNGDNQPAIDADLNQPRSVAVDGAGNLYIADRNNQRVRKVDHATGVITTVAGTGTYGYNGDNQPAIDADLNYPEGVAVDEAGNLYIADLYNQRVRRVDHGTGIITTVAGTGTGGYNGDNQPAIDADLNYLEGVAVDEAGNLYIADTGNQRVRRVEEAVVFSVVQDPPDPVVMTAGVSTQLAFTVSANTTVTAGQTITLGFPSGVGLAPDGVVRYRCPDTGIDTSLPVTVGPDGSVSLTAPEITASTACFYTADVQASTIPEGTVSIGDTTQPIHFRINL
ncbi:hypothetical protein [Nocardia sp. CA-135398]|uniref:hypothetical protein n=1 Tax=Nocardia sp. CA-135398 TaxID=3239977 RepID=UPI003D95EC2F